MKIVIVGNGVAGTICGKTIRELDSQAEITIVSEEPHPYYPRPNLIDFLAGLIPLEKVFAFGENWAERQRLELRLGQRVLSVDPTDRSIELADGSRLKADHLVLATGARPSVPPVPGNDLKGIFTVRTLDDVLGLLDYVHLRPQVVILGGGLLGLEIARALSLRGLDRISVVEVFPRLLPRQLDETGARMLQSYLEAIGLKFYTGQQAAEIVGDGQVRAVHLQDGRMIPAEAVIFASGVKPRLELAQAAGLPCSSGVVVDDYLRTGCDRIYAIGDVAEHRGRVYGLIPAAFEQARVLAYNLCGQEKRYEGTVPFSTLKVAGIYLTSVGLISPEGDGFEIISNYRPESGIYKKLVLKDDRVVGAIWFGTRKGAQEIARLVQSGKKINQYKNEILEEGFDFSVIFDQPV